MKTHSDETPHKCSTCTKGFKEKSDLKRHSRIHTRDLPRECAVYGEGFSESRSLTTHMTTHSKETSPSKSCWNISNKALTILKEDLSSSSQTEKQNVVPTSKSTWNEGNLPGLHYVDDPFVVNIKTECDD